MTLRTLNAVVISSVIMAVFSAATTGAAKEEEEPPALPKPQPDDPRPIALVRLMDKAPTIDGAIADGEWNTLHVARLIEIGPKRARKFLQQRAGEFWVGSDGSDLFIAVRSAVHPEKGALAKRKPRSGLRDVNQINLDDSVEIWIDSAPWRKEGKHYQLMVNTKGAQADVMWDRKFNSERRYWRPENYRIEQKIDKAVWTVELAVPLAQLDISDPAQPIGLRICRNFQQPSDQSRWAINVDAYSDRTTMPCIAFAKGIPVVQEISLQKGKGVKLAVEVINPDGKPVDINVALEARVGDSPAATGGGEETVPAGKSASFKLDRPIEPGKTAAVSIRVHAGDKLLYHRLFNAQPWEGNGWE